MKILYFYPEYPLLTSQGNHARAKVLLDYFKDKSIDIDLVSEQSDQFSDNEVSVLKENNLVKNVFFLSKFNKKKKPLTYLFKVSLKNLISAQIKQFNRVRPTQQESFNKILKNNSYDFIIISYACWAPLIEKNSYLKNAKTIVDTHDFLTSQFQNTKKFQLGSFFEKEIQLLNLFDKVFVISNEEKYLFSQFISKPIHIITHPLPTNFEDKNVTKKYDLIYVASDNSHNVKAAKWFFESVYPKLNPSIKIMVIGKIGKHFNDFSNVEKIDYVVDLKPFYNDSKIAICPMLSGTGLKIKVIEALSFGLPIVCNEKGIDGMLNKSNNGCLVSNDENEFKNYIEKLLTDDSFYQKTKQFGQNYFLENNSKDNVYNTFDKIFNL